MHSSKRRLCGMPLFLNVLTFSNIQTLLKALLSSECSPTVRNEAIVAAAQYEHRLCKGQKAIYHLEAFVATFMDIYLTSLNNMAMEH